MKQFAKKGILQKIIILLLIVMLIYPNYSFGATFGGKLITPINDFLIAIGDGLTIVLQRIFMPEEKKDAIEYHEPELGGLIGDLTRLGTSIDVLGLVDKINGEGTSDENLALTEKQGEGVIKFGPATIFSNKIKVFDINFFNPISDDSSAGQLKVIVSKAYNVLRTIATVGLLSVLVFIGIRILLNSSSSNNQAKYKQMLLDWVLALCLIFIMHYLMSGLIFIVNKINGMFQGSLVTTGGYDVLFCLIRDMVTGASTQANRFGYILMYFCLIVFTVVFAFQYLKRVIYMAFLTIIAPLVALTYPIDKINDGKAQAFDMWFKEYIFNLLIQPMHIILYYVLVSSATELALNNPIYGIVAIGFMLPAEKLLRKFFGFEKAQTPGGLLGGPAGTALAMTAMNKILGKNPAGGAKNKIGKGGSNGKESNNDDGGNSNIHYNMDATDVMASDNSPIMSSDNELNDNQLSGNLSNDNLGNTVNSQNIIGGNNNLDDINNQNLQGDSYYDRFSALANEEGRNTSGDISARQRMRNAGIKADNAKRKIQSTSLYGMPKRTINKAKSIKNKALKTPTGRAVKYYAKGVLNKKPFSKIGKAGIKTATGALTGAAAGTMGLAIGMATGDISKAIQYTGASAISGYKLGTGIPTGVKNVTGNIKDAFTVEGTTEAYYGAEEYKERQVRKQIKEKQKDYELKTQLEKDFDKEEVKNIRENILPDCVKYGITDNKDISAIAKMEKEGIRREQAIAVATDVNSIGKNTHKLGAKDSEDLNKTLFNRFKANKNIRNDEQAKERANTTRNLMDTYSKLKFKS